MNLIHHPSPPDVASVASELELGEVWDTAAVGGLIRSKSDHLTSPAFLYLGKKEAALLTQHLAEAFGSESVPTLHDTYYMGLDVIAIDCESFLATGGCKTRRTLQDPIARRPEWRERHSSTLWQFRI